MSDLSPTLEPWLDKRGLAEYLACGVRTIERELTQGMPRAVVFGRVKFKASQVELWLEQTGRLKRYGDAPDGELSRNPAGAPPRSIVDRVTQPPKDGGPDEQENPLSRRP